MTSSWPAAQRVARGTARAARRPSHRHMLGEAVAGRFRTLPLIDGGNQDAGEDGRACRDYEHTQRAPEVCELSQSPIGHHVNPS